MRETLTQRSIIEKIENARDTNCNNPLHEKTENARDTNGTIQ